MTDLETSIEKSIDSFIKSIQETPLENLSQIDTKILFFLYESYRRDKAPREAIKIFWLTLITATLQGKASALMKGFIQLSNDLLNEKESIL